MFRKYRKVNVPEEMRELVKALLDHETGVEIKDRLSVSLVKYEQCCGTYCNLNTISNSFFSKVASELVDWVLKYMREKENLEDITRSDATKRCQQLAGILY